MELRPPRAKKSHTQSSSAWNAVQNRKMFQLQKKREVQTQWNTSHTHLERGTNFIIIQVRLHHRTAWNAAFTTWKKAAQNLHFFPDRHVQWNAGYKAPCAKDPSITPAVAPAGAAPSTRPERGSERGANEVRTRSEGDPQSFTNFTAYPAEETRESSLTSTYPACEREWLEWWHQHPHCATSSHHIISHHQR